MHIEDGGAHARIVDNLSDHVRCADLSCRRVCPSKILLEGGRIGRPSSFRIARFERFKSYVPHLEHVVLYKPDGGGAAEHQRENVPGPRAALLPVPWRAIAPHDLLEG